VCDLTRCLRATCGNSERCVGDVMSLEEESRANKEAGSCAVGGVGV